MSATSQTVDGDLMAKLANQISTDMIANPSQFHNNTHKFDNINYLWSWWWCLLLYEIVSNMWFRWPFTELFLDCFDCGLVGLVDQTVVVVTGDGPVANSRACVVLTVVTSTSTAAAVLSLLICFSAVSFCDVFAKYLFGSNVTMVGAAATSASVMDALPANAL